MADFHMANVIGSIECSSSRNASALKIDLFVHRLPLLTHRVLSLHPYLEAKWRLVKEPWGHSGSNKVLEQHITAITIIPPKTKQTDPCRKDA